MRNFQYAAPLSAGSIGTLFMIVNDVPQEVCKDYILHTIWEIAADAQKHDPFAMVYMLDEQRVWHKGDYSYSNSRHAFTPVGLAAVPDVILMMDVLKP